MPRGRSNDSRLLQQFIDKGGRRAPQKRRRRGGTLASSKGDSKDPGPSESVEIILPIYTQWFDVNSVGKIEEECAVNIYMGLGLEEHELLDSYKQLRNTIIALYRRDPSRYITVTDCIRNIDDDASLIMKVHTLLDYWGIINFQARNEYGERIFNNFPTSTSEHTMSSFNSFINKVNSMEEGPKDQSTIDNVVKLCTELNSTTFNNPNNVHRRCYGCSVPCTTSYYVLSPNNDEISGSLRNYGVWCSLCYGNSNYPLSLSKSKFMRVDVPVTLSESIGRILNGEKVWKVDDFERLYEAIKRYGTDWNGVAHYMGNDTTPNECLFQFINAPLESEVSSKTKLTTYMDNSKGDDTTHTEFPFVDSPNTIVALLSFCASVISPVVASTAAKAAFNIIYNNTTKCESTVTGNDHNEKDDKELITKDDSSSCPSSSNPSQPNKTNADDSPNTNVLSDLKLVKGNTLQLAAAAALGAAVARAEELALLETERLSQTLPTLISLKIKRIREKLKLYKNTEKRMKDDQLHLEQELHRILKCKGYL